MMFVVVLAGGAGLALGSIGREPAAGSRQAVGTVAPSTVAPVPPEIHPTRGEYVPPRPVPTTRAPEPVVRPTPTPTPSRTTREPRRVCPREWLRNPYLRRWCERNGFQTR